MGVGRWRWWAFSCIAVVLCVPISAWGGGWDISISGFGGLSQPWSRAFEWSMPGVLDITGKNVSFQSSAVLGGKLTFWSLTPHGVDPVNFGIELEAFQFRPNIKMQSVSADGTAFGTPVAGTLTFNAPIDLQTEIYSLNFLVRYPLGVSPDLPSGRFNVYLGPGAGVQMTRLRQPGVGDAHDTAPMIQGLVGARLFLVSHVSVFSEYKYTHAHQSFDSAGSQYKFNLDSNHFLAGASVHF